MKEREQKCLLTKRQHRKLCEFVKVFYKYNIACDTQTNYYYDTLDLFFDRNQTTVRIREKDGIQEIDRVSGFVYGEVSRRCGW